MSTQLGAFGHEPTRSLLFLLQTRSALRHGRRLHGAPLLDRHVDLAAVILVHCGFLPPPQARVDDRARTGGKGMCTQKVA